MTITDSIAAKRLGYNIAVERLFDQMPTRFRKLPVSPSGFPVPKFVKWIDGVPDFRIVDSAHLRRCAGQKMCWLCGEPLGRHMAFVIGPMCAINRVSSEPPSHRDCARFAVKACPFLANPERKRDTHTELPADKYIPGFHLDRNPGVSLIWITDSYTRFRPQRGGDGTLFQIGPPVSLEWYARGRAATREEIMASIESGLPQLRKIAALDGCEAMIELEQGIVRGLALVPA